MNRREALIDQALKHLEEPAAAELKATRRLEKVLVEAKKTGDLKVEELERATIELVKEADIPRYFAKSEKDGTEEDVATGLGFLFLLILLLILLALAPDDSDAKILIQDLIDQLLGR